MNNLGIHSNSRLLLNKNTKFILTLTFIIGFQWVLDAQTRVNSLRALKPYLNDNNVNVKLRPGAYTVTAKDVADGLYDNPTKIGTANAQSLFLFEGNNSTYDFTGVTINVETAVLRAYGNIDFYELHIVGSNNVLKNLTMVDVGSVNDAPRKRTTNVVMDGRKNRIEGFKLTIKGSNPYGYGDIFGKGGATVIRHQKHSGVLVRGESNHLKNTTLIHRAYGHGIFMQASNKALIEGCYVEGELRTTDEVLAERGTAAANVNFMTVWGYKLQPGWTFSKQEDGIRDYSGGATVVDGKVFERGASNTTVIDCTVKYMRSGVTIGLGRGSQRIENVTALGCESGFWARNDADVINCKGDASVGPLYSEDRETRNVNIDLTLLDNDVRKYGNTPSLYIAGSGHNITLKDGTRNTRNKDVNIIIGGTRLGHRWLAGSGEEPPFKEAKNITFNNKTEFPISLGRNSNNNDVNSCGTVTDRGSRNEVSKPRDCGNDNPPPPSDSKIVHIRKSNASNFAIDGGRGGANGQNTYLWSSNASNKNQQWNEINRGNGFYSYQKRGTNFCIDGGNGGINKQNVYLWTCKDNNQNQHWQKVSTGSGNFKLIKRNAPYAIDGGNRGANRQNIGLYDASNRSQNLQWRITPVNNVNKAISLGNRTQKIEGLEFYPNPVKEVLNIEFKGEEATFSLINLIGQKVHSGILRKGNNTIALDNLDKGVYIIKINHDGETLVKKIMND